MIYPVYIHFIISIDFFALFFGPVYIFYIFIEFLWYSTPKCFELLAQFSVLFTTGFRFSLSFSMKGKSNTIYFTVCAPFLEGTFSNVLFFSHN